MRAYGRRFFDLRVPSIKDSRNIISEDECNQHNIRIPDGVWMVTDESPMVVRKAVARLALYFKREFSYDFIQYDARENDPLARAFLFTTRDYDREHYYSLAVGACCFRWREWDDAPPAWALQWVWLHPFMRRQGVLSRAWSFFEARFSGFEAEPPLSDAMVAFLKSQGTKET
jgi:hypothetical protein